MNVTLVSIDLNLMLGNTPHAVFTVTSPTSKVNIAYTAISGQSINTIIGTLNNQNTGTISVTIPNDTIAIKFDFTNSANQRVVKYYPNEFSSNFTRFDLPLLLTTNHCNTQGLYTAVLDNSPVQPGETRTFGQQLGPCRMSMASGKAHMAMFEAWIIVNGTYTSYLNLPRVYVQPSSVSCVTRAAMLQAFYSVLISLYSTHATRLNAILAAQMALLPNNNDRVLGVIVGNNAANALFANRENDNTTLPDLFWGSTYTGSGAPGEWEKDPISNSNLALGAQWPLVTPFTLTSASQFRTPAPPALNSAAFALQYNEVKSLGGNVVNTATVRSQDATEIGIFFGFDATTFLCAPGRLYNEISKQIILSKNLTAIQILYILTVLNVAMADAAIAAWDVKYHYKTARPVTLIRRGDELSNPNCVKDVSWVPLGLPASNHTGTQYSSPAFPGLVSGHAVFMSTIAEILRNYLGTDIIDLEFVSAEYNGFTTDYDGIPRPFKPRLYRSLSQMEEDNGQSRIYNGIHVNQDKTDGIIVGHNVGNWVYNHIYQLA